MESTFNSVSLSSSSSSSTIHTEPADVFFTKQQAKEKLDVEKRRHTTESSIHEWDNVIYSIILTQLQRRLDIVLVSGDNTGDPCILLWFQEYGQRNVEYVAGIHCVPSATGRTIEIPLQLVPGQIHCLQQHSFTHRRRNNSNQVGFCGNYERFRFPIDIDIDVDTDNKKKKKKNKNKSSVHRVDRMKQSGTDEMLRVLYLVGRLHADFLPRIQTWLSDDGDNGFSPD